MKKRFDSLQVLRAFGCIVVFLAHCGIDFHGIFVVNMFFMISGFTLTYSGYEKAHLADIRGFGSLRYAFKRMIKMYPLYIICQLPVLVLDLLNLMRAYSPEGGIFLVKKIVASIFLVQAWSPNSEISLAFNGVAWYLSVTFFLYFAFPFILRQIKKFKNISSLIILALALYAFQLGLGFAAAPLRELLVSHAIIPDYWKFEYWLCYIFPPARAVDFVIGCCMAAIYLKSKEESTRRKSICFELTGIAFLAIGLYIYWMTDSILTSEAFRYNQIFIPAAAFWVYAFVLGKGPLVKLMTNRFTLYIGNLSADFFLIHQNVIRFTTLFLSYFIAMSTIKYITPVLCFALTVAACLIWKWLQQHVTLRRKA